MPTDPASKADPADLADLTYEQARDELITIVAQLESGQVCLLYTSDAADEDLV